MNWNQPQRGGNAAKPAAGRVLRGRRRLAASAIAALLIAAAFVAAYLAWRKRDPVAMNCDPPAGDGRDPIRAFPRNSPAAAGDSATVAIHCDPPTAADGCVATNAQLAAAARPKTIAEAVAMVRLKPGMHRFNSVDEVFSKTNEHQVGEYRKPLFRRDFERQLELIATRRRDMAMPPMPPLPPGAEREFAESLAEDFAAADGEDPKDTETRLRVEEMKREMQRLVDAEGLTFGQAFHRMEAEHNRRANMTQLYRGAYIKMRLSGDPDAASFLKEANGRLRDAGACEIGEDGGAVNP